MVSLQMLGHEHCAGGNVIFGSSSLEDIHSAYQKNLLSSGCPFPGTKKMCAGLLIRLIHNLFYCSMLELYVIYVYYIL